jgi:N-methylhydantoinase B
MGSAPSENPKWDGKVYPYIAPKELRIDASLTLDHAAADQLDPITYEVLRYALWNLNVEHGNTIVKVSGSPIAAYSHDFNPALLDENGDFVLFGPFLQYLSSALGSAVKWTMEYRSENPGIQEGDIFLTNDPWVGATHQSDVALLAPVFWEGKLFGWVANSLHQWDMGGTSPGGFNPIAEDVYWESAVIPPIKIVEHGVLRRDLEESYVRHSRMPSLVALDLRAEIAGCNVARERLLTLIQRYGAATVKAAMRKIQDDSEKAFVRRLRTIPDGSWSAETWLELKAAGDRGLYRNALKLTKRGDRLIFSNAGSAPQEGALNCTYIAWRGAIASMVSVQMLYDQMFAVEGAYRHMEFDVAPGTISCARFPGAVSSGPALTVLQTISLASLVISKMLASSSDPELRGEVMSLMGTAAFPIAAISGVNQHQANYASFLLEPLGGGFPATSYRDGVDTGGLAFDIQSMMPNAEENEWFYPILYLWRKELADSGGAGKYRGGNSGEIAIVAHDTERVNMYLASAHNAIPGLGQFGGMPSAPSHFVIYRNDGGMERARATAHIPADVSELIASAERLPPKAYGIQLGPHDTFVMGWAGASGYGDPLDRDLELIEKDLRDGAATANWAGKIYGVVFDQNGAIDKEATVVRRAEIKRARLANVPERKRRAKLDLGASRVVAEGLVLATVSGDPMLGCQRCGENLCRADQNYKEYCASNEETLVLANPYAIDPQIFVDEQLVFRSYACPECGTMLATGIELKTDRPHWDISFAINGVSDVTER